MCYAEGFIASMDMVPNKIAPQYFMYSLTTDDLSGQVPFNKLRIVYVLGVGRDSSVGTVTCYWLDGPGIESRWGRDFPNPLRPALGPTQPPIQMGTGYFSGVKRPGGGVDHPTPSSAEVKERVELYIYSSYGPSWPVLG